jgi:hypothetical protein
MADPALTAETPETRAAPAAPTSDAPGDQPKPPDSAPDQKPEDGADDQPEPKHELPKGVQKRIDRLTRDKYRLQAELDVARRQAPAQQAQPRSTAANANGAPKPEQFKSYEEFLEARAEWKAEQKVSAVLSEMHESTRRQSAEAEQSRLAQTWEERVGKASEVYDDFEEVALSPDLPISEAMMAALVRTEKGPDVAYYLGKHREVAAQLSTLDPFSAAIRIGEIAATLSQPAPKKTTNAPEPINPVGGRASPTKDPARMTDAEFAAWRREQIKRR